MGSFKTMEMEGNNLNDSVQTNQQISNSEISNVQIASLYVTYTIPEVDNMHQKENLRKNEKIQQLDNAQIINPTYPGSLYRFPNPADIFVGRDVDIDNLLKLIQEHRKVIMIGTAGLGKTCLAIHSARAWVQRNIFNKAVFVIMEKDHAAKLVFHDLAELIPDKTELTDNVISEVYEYYNKYKTIFIFDNIEDIRNSILDKYLPENKFTNIFILATSNDTKFECFFELYPLKPLSESSSIDLIYKLLSKNKISTSKFKKDKQKLKKLAEMLNYNPLALEEAANMMADIVINKDEYPLENFNELMQQINEHVKNKQTSLNKKILMKKIENEDVRKLLFCMPNLDVSRIYSKIFHDQSSIDKTTIEKLIRELKRYSLITFGNESETVTINNFIQNINLKNGLIPDTKQKNYLRILFNIFCYDDCDFSDHLHFLFKYVPKEILSDIYIETFYSNDILKEHLVERLKQINCDISDIKHWSACHYCVFAGHKILFNFFNSTSNIDNTSNGVSRYDVDAWLVFHAQIVKKSHLYIFSNFGLSLKKFLKWNYREINKPSIKNITIIHACAAYHRGSKKFYNTINTVWRTSKEYMLNIENAVRNITLDLQPTVYRSGTKYDYFFEKFMKIASKRDQDLTIKLMSTSEFNYVISDFGKTLLWWAVANNFATLTWKLIDRGIRNIGTDVEDNKFQYSKAEVKVDQINFVGHIHFCHEFLLVNGSDIQRRTRSNFRQINLQSLQYNDRDNTLHIVL